MREQHEQYELYNRPLYDFKSCDFSANHVHFFDVPLGAEDDTGAKRTPHETNLEIANQMPYDFELRSINVRPMLKYGVAALNAELVIGEILVELLIGSWRPFQLPLRWFVESLGRPYSFEPYPFLIVKNQNFCVRLTPTDIGKSLMGFVMVTLDGAYKCPIA